MAKKKVLLSLDERMLEVVDLLARAHYCTRSEFIRKRLVEFIHRNEPTPRPVATPLPLPEEESVVSLAS